MIVHKDAYAEMIVGDNRDILKGLAGAGFQMCVTSPPYFGLRDYGNDAQIGLEATPEAYISELVQVFRLVRDTLADDGTLWLNIGDSYSSHKDCKSIGQTLAKGTSRENAHVIDIGKSRTRDTKMLKSQGLKNKDLIGIPWMLAFALRADGWYLRQDIIWHKPNPMPESVRDRCIKAHEYVFLLSKSPKYFYDNEAIKEPAIYALNSGDNRPPGIVRDRLYGYDSKEAVLRGRVVSESANGITIRHPNGKHGDMQQSPKTIVDMKNKRSVWSIAPRPFKGAHFAVFPPALVEPCILAGSKVGDTIIDPFGGSGTSGGVALKYGRNAVLLELSQEYADIFPSRVEAILK